MTPLAHARVAPLLLATAVLPGCGPGLDLVEDPSYRTLPRTAPGVLLLAALEDDLVRVHGTVTDGLWFDLDESVAREQAFEYALVDAAGTTLYSNGFPGPMQVREYLGAYTEPYGVDLLAAYPQIGHFPLLIPRLDGAVEVRFSLRDEAGRSQEAGVFPLSQVDAIAADIADAHPEPVGTEALWTSGDPEHRLDIAILGDGYTADQMDTFRDQAAAVADEILGREPFGAYAGGINVWRVDTPSEDEGASFDCTGLAPCVDDWADNALGSIFAIAMINGLLGTDYSDRMVFQLDQWKVAKVAAHVPFDTVMVLVNTGKHGGFAVYYASFTNADDRYAEVGTHELGHSLGLLGDEYVSDACVVSPRLGLPPNVSEWADGDPSWAAWIDPATPLPTPSDAGDDVVGMFPGAFNCTDLYRPAPSCKMKTNYGEFCPVCREQIVRRIYDHVDPIQSTTPEVSWRPGGWEVSVPTLHGDVGLEWQLDGKVVQDTEANEPLVLRAEDVAEGEHVLSLRAVDRSSWMRGNDAGLVDEVWWRFAR